MGLIRVLDHVNHCYSNDDGQVIQSVLRESFDKGEAVVLSFSGVDSASSSFLNTAFIELLNDYSFNFIKSKLSFADTTRTINESIKRRFQFEVNERKNLVNV